MRDERAVGSGLRRLAAGAAVVLLVGCAQLRPQPAEVPAGPPPAGQARIWFYRDYSPSTAQNLANVALNGARVGSVPAYKGILYRDVAPGHYHVSVESFGDDSHQSKDIDLKPGQEAYVKILVNESWMSTGFSTSFQRPTFDVALMPADVAHTEIANAR